MPFVAQSHSTRQRIDITTIDRPREILRPDDIICQLCGSPMIVKAGFIITPHFAHKSNGDCANKWGAHPESPEHRMGKLLIAEYLRRELGPNTGARIEFEVPIREVMRIADVMVIYPNGWRVAHECQLAGITTETLSKRTEDYLRAGVDVFWWLGKSAATLANLNWAASHQGESIELHITQQYRSIDMEEHPNKPVRAGLANGRTG